MRVLSRKPFAEMRVERRGGNHEVLDYGVSSWHSKYIIYSLVDILSISLLVFCYCLLKSYFIWYRLSRLGWLASKWKELISS